MSKRPIKTEVAREPRHKAPQHEVPRRKQMGVSLEAFEEVKMIYDAWIGYLLGMLGTDTLRVKVEDIHKGLGEYVLSARREGDEYIVSILHRPCEAQEDAGGDPAASEEDGHE